jgi:hypothetical protein
MSARRSVTAITDGPLFARVTRFIRFAESIREVSSVEASEQDGIRSTNRDVVSAGLVVFGLYLVGLSIFAVLAPGTFFDELGRFGPRNDHYIHDVAAFQAAVGLLLLLALRWPAWRVPALVATLLQFGLHTVSHLVDMNEADPEWVGVVELVGLAVTTAVVAWLLRRASRSVAV